MNKSFLSRLCILHFSRWLIVATQWFSFGVTCCHILGVAPVEKAQGIESDTSGNRNMKIEIEKERYYFFF